MLTFLFSKKLILPDLETKRWKETDKKREDRLFEKEEDARCFVEFTHAVELQNPAGKRNHACKTVLSSSARHRGPSTMLYHKTKSNSRKFVKQHI